MKIVTKHAVIIGKSECVALSTLPGNPIKGCSDVRALVRQPLPQPLIPSWSPSPPSIITLVVLCH